MKKIISIFVCAVMLLTMFTGCANNAEKTDVNVIAISGPTGIGMANLMKENADKKAANNYNFSVVTSPESIVAKISNGECDIAAVPTNLASVLYNKLKGGVKVLAVNTLGVLYILENGNSIKSIDDLKGKEIYSTGQGANPEYVLNYTLSKNGIDPKKDLKVNYLTENQELATKMISGKVSVALVPQPIATTIMLKNTNVRSAIDMTAEWKSVSNGNNLMMGCVIVRSDFAKDNKKAVNTFLKEYKKSIENTTKDIDLTAANCEEFKVLASADIAKKAIPSCNIVYIDGENMKKELSEYLNVLFEADKTSVGGKLPDDDFYYKK